MASWAWSPCECLVVHDVFELRDGVRVVSEDISPLFGWNVQRWTGRGVEAGLHRCQGRDKRHRIDARIDVRRGRDMRVAEDLLRDLQVAGQVENALCERVPEEMRMDGHTCLAADVTQRRLERCISQWLAASLPQSDPEGFGAFSSAAFFLEITFVHRP